MIRYLCVILTALLVTPTVVTSARADDVSTLWRIQGAANTLYLAGSVHVLRPSDHPLPEAFDAAYDDAEVLVMELDMDDLDPLHLAAVARQRGLMSDGRTLRDVIGAEKYRELSDRASEIGIDLDMLRHAKPWFAAMTVIQVRLTKMGYRQNLGLEMYFTNRAQSDNKEIVGLESAEFQLGIFDNLSFDMQLSMLEEALDDEETSRKLMDDLVAAWRSGVATKLDELTRGAYVEHPEIYDALFVSRNKSFTKRVVELLDDDTDYLVVVGAGHLVGEDGIVEMLKDRGVAADQL